MVVARHSHGQLVIIDRLREMVRLAAGVAENIYSGVAHTMPSEPGKRLVADIGGGSTELIIGEGLNPLELESLQMGCVSWSERFFRDGKLSLKRFERARLAARLELEPVQAEFRTLGWDNCVGSSGTVRAIGEVIRALEPAAATITPAGITRAIDYCVDAGHTRELTLEPVTEDRRPVFPGGLAILAEIFSVLDIGEMRIAEGAMREGLLYDMLGRYRREDARERTVRAMQQRYHVDIAQAERVEATARNFLEQTREAWKLEEPLAHLALKWAARLHEIGLDVSHSGYHRHGAYLLENGDMPGFPREEQRLLARLVGAHRRKLMLEGLEELVPPWDRSAVNLIVLLRVAVLLHRGRSSTALPLIELSATPRSLEMRFPAGWLRDHPLTSADLQQEVDYLRMSGFRLRVFSGR